MNLLFFAQRCFVLFRSLLFSSSSSFPLGFFFYSKINFPSSSSTDAPVAVISFFSHIFFCDSNLSERLCWQNIKKKKKPKKIFFSQQTFSLCDICLFMDLYCNKYHQNIYRKIFFFICNINNRQ